MLLISTVKSQVGAATAATPLPHPHVQSFCQVPKGLSMQAVVGPGLGNSWVSFRPASFLLLRLIFI
jgi:hypothetical protein